jgi:hypothetical protein
MDEKKTTSISAASDPAKGSEKIIAADPTAHAVPTALKTNDEQLKNISQLFNDLLGLMKTHHPESGNPNGVSLDQKKLMAKLNKNLADKPAISVAFPACSDVLLSLVNLSNNAKDIDSEFFSDYFSFDRHDVLDSATRGALSQVVDSSLLSCGAPQVKAAGSASGTASQWPPAWCFPAPCITLQGKRHFYPCEKDASGKPVVAGCQDEAQLSVSRLFLADAAWLFFMDRMGIFQILGKLLDEYACHGGLPISNGNSFSAPKDDVVALVLEAMTRQLEMGTSSKVRDRTCVYRTCLGWSLDNGKALNLNTVVNSAFSTQFHRFIKLSLEYFKDKRLATAIQGSLPNGSKLSVATVVTIRDTVKLLQKSFDSFNYSRNYHSTLSGIVWAVSAFSIVKELRNTIGIPDNFKEPHEFIPAAYDILVLKKPITSSEVNRFEVHYECASNIRDLLLDVELLAQEDMNDTATIENWLSINESKIEGYRTAYRSLTGIDLGVETAARVEQAAV